jgi:hypothetical protein
LMILCGPTNQPLARFWSHWCPRRLARSI